MFKSAIAAALLAATALGIAATGQAGPPRTSQPVPSQVTPLRVNHTMLRAEGTLLASPQVGVDLSVAKLVEPSVLSIDFSDEKVAWNFYHEAVGNGEHVCLSDLGVQPAEFRGRRYWLRSC